VVATDNITSHGHVTISEAVTTYTPPAVSVEGSGASAPAIALRQSLPNPTHGETTIGYLLPAAAHVTLGSTTSRGIGCSHWWTRLGRPARGALLSTSRGSSPASTTTA